MSWFISVADLHRQILDACQAPFSTQFSPFYVAVRKIWPNDTLMAPPSGLAHPLGNPGSAPGFTPGLPLYPVISTFEKLLHRCTSHETMFNVH